MKFIFSSNKRDETRSFLSYKYIRYRVTVDKRTNNSIVKINNRLGN